MVRAIEGQASTLADRPPALYRPCSYFRVGLADVRRKSEADTERAPCRAHGVDSIECPGPDSNRHDAFRHRRILSPLCLPVSPPGQRDHCNGAAWATGGGEIAPHLPRCLAHGAAWAPPPIFATSSATSAGAWRQLLPNLGTFTSVWLAAFAACPSVEMLDSPRLGGEAENRAPAAAPRAAAQAASDAV